MDLALDNLERLIGPKTQPTNQLANSKLFLCVCMYLQNLLVIHKKCENVNF